MSEDALRALFHPFESGQQDIPPAGSDVLFVNGAVCAGLGLFSGCKVAAQQYFRPYAAALAVAGYDVLAEVPDGGAAFDVALVLCAKQRQETMAALAAALNALKAGGLLVCAGANDGGGRRLAQDLQDLGMTVQAESKYRSRIITGRKTDIRQDRLDAAVAEGACREIADGRYISRPGVFSWDRVDAGSALLAEILPEMNGQGADFGCGYGFFSAHIVETSSGVTALACVDADARAVECCRRTLALRPTGAKLDFLWADVTAAGDFLPRNLDWIVMNPPFHEGQAALPRVGMAFIARAASCLKPGGVLWMVANAGLPYEKILAENFTRSDKLREGGGYKLYRAEK